MNIILILFLVAVVGFFFIFPSFIKNEEGKKKVSLYKSKQLMTNNEIDFFNQLKESLPECHVFPQVCMGAIISPTINSSDKNFWKVRNSFGQKIIDYVICDNKMKILCLVELDDKTHDSVTAKEKDKIRDQITKDAGYKTIRWDSRNKPSVSEIAKIINK